MSLEAFKALTAEETEQLLLAPATVTLLVARVDEKIDRKEEAWASKLVNYRTVTAEAELQPYYEAVATRFDADLDKLTQDWTPGDTESLISKLEALTPIVEKLDDKLAKILKQSWRTLAEQVAKASGGLIGFGSISDEERAVINLSMLN